ncbi:uncharacterized protein LOC127538744 [Antechinus flavipes]|uniref:uncharacterized protein LOC127538744 n=1 Tax=Antechinus flavipes TaxID=38775 RepID=UPI0022354C87|nr:uncharacterized protein LOC127538744 [Antechinus flavipes]
MVTKVTKGEKRAGHQRRNSNGKPIQPTFQMKGSFTNQEVGKGVEEKQKVDASKWDSPSPSQKNESPRNSNDLTLQRDYSCKSLQSKDQLASTEFGKIAIKENEASAPGAGSGPDPGSKVGVQIEKSVPQKQCESPLGKEKQKEGKKDVKQESKLKGLSDGEQESFSKNNQKQDKVTLETTSIPEQMAPKEQVKSLSAPFLNKKRMSEVPESSRKSHGDDMHSSAETTLKESCKKTWIEEDKKGKNKPKIKTTESKQVYCKICEKGKIAHQTKDNLPKDDFKESKEILEASPTLAKNFRDSVEKKKHKRPLRGKVLKSFSGQTEHDRDAVLKNLEMPFQENVPVFSPNVCPQKSTLQLKNDNEPEIQCTCKVNEEDIACVAKNPELITARKSKEKTKHKAISFESSHHNVSNSTDELNRWRPSLCTSKMPPEKEMEEEKKKHQHNVMEISEGKDGGNLIDNRTGGKINKRFSMKNHQNGNDEENKIPREEIPIMDISSKENLPVHHVLKG